MLKPILRIVTAAILVLIGLYFLQAMTMTAWLGSFPEVTHKDMWALRAYIFLGYGVGLIFLGHAVILFRARSGDGRRSFFNWTLPRWLFVLSVISLATPHIYQILSPDSCKLEGKRWSIVFARCK